jgi:hypothetical protein
LFICKDGNCEWLSNHKKRNDMEALFEAIGEFFAWLLERWAKKE